MNNNLVKILGCGSSSGVPTPGCKCNICNSKNKKNHRSRTSLYVRNGNDNILIDCGPDLRNQMIKNNISHFDRVFLTHKHSDHIAGMDDLRSSFFNKNHEQIKCYGNLDTITTCSRNFSYMFQEIKYYNQNKYFLEPETQDHDSQLVNKKPLLGEIIEPFDVIKINENLSIQAFEQNHGRINSMGYLFGNFAYSTDFHHIPEKGLNLLKNANLQLWIVSLTLMEGNKAHASLDQLKSFINYVKPKRVIFTHMNHTIDYNNSENLPKNSEFGYDGMEIMI